MRVKSDENDSERPAIKKRSKLPLHGGDGREVRLRRRVGCGIVWEEGEHGDGDLHLGDGRKRRDVKSSGMSALKTAASELLQNTLWMPTWVKGREVGQAGPLCLF